MGEKKKHLCKVFNFDTCNNQYIVYICTDDLSKNKVANQSTTALNPSNAYTAGNAVDGNIKTCMRTEDIGTTGSYHKMWWKVDLGGVYNIFSVDILFMNYPGFGIVLSYIIYYM